MMTQEVVKSIDECVLCWLATVSTDGVPNVSPKEAFLYDGRGKILVANIASPVTVRNIEHGDQVCISFVNIFVQKGYKITGRATVLKPEDKEYEVRHRMVVETIGATFPVMSIIEIEPDVIDEIVAPSYRLFPDTGPLDRIRESMESYRVAEYQKRAELDRAGQSATQSESR